MQGSHVWVGPEPLRRHQLRQMLTGAEVCVDASDGVDAVLEAVNGGGLFASTVRVRNLDALDASELGRVAKAVSSGGCPVVAEAAKLPAASQKALGDTFEIHTVSGGRNVGGRRTYQDIARALGLTVDAALVDELCERAETDPGRAVGVLEALSAGEYREPTRNQVSLLLGTTGAPGMPWTLLDHIERGRASQARDLLGQVDVIPAIGFLAKRTLIAAICAERPTITDAELDSAVGSVSASAAAAGRRMGQRIGPQGCRGLLGVLAAADTASKRGNPEAALLLAVGYLTVAFAAASGAGSAAEAGSGDSGQVG